MFFSEFLFILFRGACKISKPYDMPLCGVRYGGNKNIREPGGYIPELGGYIRISRRLCVVKK